MFQATCEKIKPLFFAKISLSQGSEMNKKVNGNGYKQMAGEILKEQVNN